MTSARRPRARDIVIVSLLVAGLVAGVVLVIVGGGAADQGAPSNDGAPDARSGTVPSEDVSIGAVEQWAGLDIPDDAANFLTARLGVDQLDLTFTMSSDDEARFISDSGLPEPVEGERQIMHSSPLWQLNPGQDDADETTSSSSTTTTIAQPELRGTADTRSGVRRSVELVDEGPDTVRARIVLAPA